MKAAVIREYGGPGVLHLEDVTLAGYEDVKRVPRSSMTGFGGSAARGCPRRRHEETARGHKLD